MFSKTMIMVMEGYEPISESIGPALFVDCHASQDLTNIMVRKTILIYLEEINSQGHETEKEPERIIALLPQMTPSTQRGRAVKVPYSTPVNFKLM